MVFGESGTVAFAAFAMLGHMHTFAAARRQQHHGGKHYGHQNADTVCSEFHIEVTP